MTLKETGNPIESVAEDVRNSARQAEAAAAAEGIEPNGPLGGFVGAFKWALLKLADLVERFDASLSGKMEAQQQQIVALHELGETEIERLREATRLAALTIRQAEVVQETIVTNVCKDLVKNLVSESKQWLVLAEDNITRRRTRIFAMKMSAAALALLSVSFWSGYQIRVLQDEPALQSLARCAKTPMRVAIQGQPTGDWVCKLETLAPREWRDLPDELKRRWLTWWPFSG
ncbi:hypothetical protein FM996_17990 [Methylosinus sporium]|uniref:Uncharacterized protein n=1 Tax=Methylosinus sporium TaxID=428 RepID=A0A549SH52_METSR|nr:hypothetical protein [Methylosinus sporium]TRL28968.1 hypothetical protein FM996_17990 [Methylosinus sporium]